MLAAADRLEGVQGCGVARDQGIEEMPAVPARAWFLVELSPGSSSMKRPARPGETRESSRSSILAPGEEAPHDAGVGAAGVRVRDAGGEELIGGEQRLERRRARGRPGPIGRDPRPGKRAEERFGQGSGPWRFR